MVAADARLVFGSIYSLQLQGGGSRTHLNGTAKTAPIWQAVFARDGRHFGYRYQATGIHDDFRADSGFISRGGIIHGNLNHRVTWFGAETAPLQSWTTGVQVDGIWQYKDVVVGEPLLEKKLHFNNNFKFKGGWLAGASVLFESFAFDETLYADYALERGAPSAPEIVPFVGTPHLHNRDYVLTLRLNSRGSRRVSSISGAATRTSSSGRPPTFSSRHTQSTGGPTTRSASARSTNCSNFAARPTARWWAAARFRA